MDRNKYHTYIQAWRKRFRREVEERTTAEAEAREQAHICARCLVEHFGAEQVYLIGSLSRPERFHLHSDVDLAVVGLAPDQYYRALAEIRQLAGREVDLISFEDATPDMATRIAEEGILLHGRTEIPAPQSRH